MSLGLGMPLLGGPTEALVTSSAWALAFSGSVDVGYLQDLTFRGPSRALGSFLIQPLLLKPPNACWIELCSASVSSRLLVGFYQEF